MGNLVSWLHSPSMGQTVVSVEVYERELLGASGGLVGSLLRVKHRAVVAKTAAGVLYLIEKGVNSTGDCMYKERYRKGESRIVLISEKELEQGAWKKLESVNEVSAFLTLRDLFDSCGEKYNLLVDNCHHAVEKMLMTSKPRWYEKKFNLFIALLFLLTVVFMLDPLVCTLLATPFAVKVFRWFARPKPIQWLLAVPIFYLSRAYFNKRQNDLQYST